MATLVQKWIGFASSLALVAVAVAVVVVLVMADDVDVPSLEDSVHLSPPNSHSSMDRSNYDSVMERLVQVMVDERCDVVVGSTIVVVVQLDGLAL
jgi:hypothetical protein